MDALQQGFVGQAIRFLQLKISSAELQRLCSCSPGSVRVPPGFPWPGLSPGHCHQLAKPNEHDISR